jgi:hypothetical protein
MKEDLETSLERMPLSEVPGSLDRRVEDVIRRSELGGAGQGRPRVPLWAAAMACAACLTMGFVSYPVLRPGGKPASRGPAVIYIERLGGELPGVLGGGDGRDPGGFFEQEHSAVKNVNRG